MVEKIRNGTYNLPFLLGQGSGTYGSRAICGSYDAASNSFDDEHKLAHIKKDLRTQAFKVIWAKSRIIGLRQS